MTRATNVLGRDNRDRRAGIQISCPSLFDLFCPQVPEFGIRTLQFAVLVDNDGNTQSKNDKRDRRDEEAELPISRGSLRIS